MPVDDEISARSATTAVCRRLNVVFRMANGSNVTRVMTRKLASENAEPRRADLSVRKNSKCAKTAVIVVKKMAVVIVDMRALNSATNSYSEPISNVIDARPYRAWSAFVRRRKSSTIARMRATNTRGGPNNAASIALIAIVGRTVANMRATTIKAAWACVVSLSCNATTSEK
eukprot:Amastigsp_a192632_17.p2 type:complete len:172 gc:universal Amastigsp_a192632_17:563-48(-)